MKAQADGAMSPSELSALLARVPRVPLAVLPTPLQEAPRLSAALGGPRIWVKRDDLTGLAFGGNKTRMLEFIMAQAQAREADTLIVGGDLTSNFCRQAAAAASKLGLRCVALLAGPPPWEVRGNILVEKLLGADVRFLETRPDYLQGNPIMQRAFDELVREYTAQGHRPLVVENSIRPISAVAYVQGALELAAQFDALGLAVSRIYVASMSSTQAGLQLGFKLLGRRHRVVSLSTKVAAVRDLMARLANGAAEILGVAERLSPDEFPFAEDDFAADDPRVIEAIRTLAQTEGLITDPVYTGRVAANLIRDVQLGRIERDETVVLLHTGGTPLIFQCDGELLPTLSSAPRYS